MTAIESRFELTDEDIGSIVLAQWRLSKRPRRWATMGLALIAVGAVVNGQLASILGIAFFAGSIADAAAHRWPWLARRMHRKTMGPLEARDRAIELRADERRFILVNGGVRIEADWDRIPKAVWCDELGVALFYLNKAFPVAFPFRRIPESEQRALRAFASRLSEFREV